VQLLYEEVGSQSVYRACPLDRHLRDLVTICQHIMGQTRMLEMAGGMWRASRHPCPSCEVEPLIGWRRRLRLAEDRGLRRSKVF